MAQNTQTEPKVGNTQLRNFIETNAKSIAQFAKDISVERQTIYNWLNGVTPLSRPMLFQIAQVYNVVPYELAAQLGLDTTGLRPPGRTIADLERMVQDLARRLGELEQQSI